MENEKIVEKIKNTVYELNTLLNTALLNKLIIKLNGQEIMPRTKEHHNPFVRLDISKQECLFMNRFMNF